MPKRTRDYRSWLINRLADPRAVTSYLNAALDDSVEMFLIALRNVAEARRMSRVAETAGLRRESLYRILSEEGNPRLSSLTSVLNALGLRLIIATEEPTSAEIARAEQREITAKTDVSQEVIERIKFVYSSGVARPPKISGTTSRILDYQDEPLASTGIAQHLDQGVGTLPERPLL